MHQKSSNENEKSIWFNRNYRLVNLEGNRKFNISKYFNFLFILNILKMSCKFNWAMKYIPTIFYALILIHVFMSLFLALNGYIKDSFKCFICLIICGFPYLDENGLFLFAIDCLCEILADWRESIFNGF
jgi:hypothetical protein